jgi:hypothetical protein
MASNALALGGGLPMFGGGGPGVGAGRGLKYRFPGMFHSSRLTYKRLAADGSGCISGVVLDDPGHKKSGIAAELPKKPTCLAVDYSGTSGADLVVVQVGPQVGYQVEYWMDIKRTGVKDEKGADGWHTKTREVEVDGERGYVMTLQRGPAPEVSVLAGDILVGQPAFTFDGEKITMATMAAPLGEMPAPGKGE